MHFLSPHVRKAHSAHTAFARSMTGIFACFFSGGQRNVCVDVAVTLCPVRIPAVLLLPERIAFRMTMSPRNASYRIAQFQRVVRLVH
jgi:hypothetical protein